MPDFYSQSPFLILLVLWEIPWKGVALWKAARQKDLWWFIAMLILSTGALLEILYIFFFSKKEVRQKITGLFGKKSA